MARGIIVALLICTPSCLALRLSDRLELKGSKGHPFMHLQFGLDARDFEKRFKGELEDHLRANEVESKGPVAYRKTEKPLLWQHIHKMAGSFVCTAAAANGERIVAPSDNCNWDNTFMEQKHGAGQDSFWEIGSSPEKKQFFPSCEDRAAYFKKGEFSFGMIERELRDEDICPQFRYGTVLVEPLKFIRSTLGYESGWFPREIFNKDNTKLDNEKFVSYLQSLVNTTSHDEDIVGLPDWKFLNNFVIRSVLGSHAFHLGRQKITEAHLEMAKQLLSKFDYVKVIDGDKCVWNAVDEKIGWDVALDHATVPECSNNCVGSSAISLSSEAKDLLLQLNEYDMKLWQHFAKLHNCN